MVLNAREWSRYGLGGVILFPRRGQREIRQPKKLVSDVIGCGVYVQIAAVLKVTIDCGRIEYELSRRP
jgi:hypothetical protein